MAISLSLAGAGVGPVERDYASRVPDATRRKERMAIKVHTCGVPWPKLDAHPCTRVMKALDEKGIDYEVVKHPTIGKGRRNELQALSGQRLLPVLELDDGRAVREDSKELARRIRAGELPGTPAA
jgi:glutaredoxin